MRRSRSRLLPWGAFLSSLLACSAPAPVGDGGTDAGDEGPVQFNVSGSMTVHPDAVRFLADAGQTASLVGLTLRVEEPLKVALDDPLGIFATQTLDATGAFSARNLSSDLVNLGVAVGLRDESDAGTPRVVRSATVIYDVALEGRKPSADITAARAYAIPTAFHDQLTLAITPQKVALLTADTQTTLVGAGCIIGRVVDASGDPVEGVTITPSDASKTERFFYPTADLSTTGGATSLNGLFVYVHNGGDVVTFRFGVTGHSEYKQRNAGANRDAALVVTLYPGANAP